MKSHIEYRCSIEHKAAALLKQRKHYIRIITSVSLCLVMTVCAITILTSIINNGSIIDNPFKNDPVFSNPTTPEPDIYIEQPAQSELSLPETPMLDVPVIHMNSFYEVSGARMFFDPETTYIEMWDWDDVVKYLGWDITPDYLMPGLITNPWLDFKNRIIFNNDGTIVSDTIWLEFYTEFPYDDGSQAIGGDSTGIRIIASKMGHLNDHIIIWEDNMVESLINDTVVKFGHRSLGYGGTYENPDFYFDLYVAEFEIVGVSFQVISSNISEEEFVKMVQSLIMTK
jgi:hypothetical protein